MAGGLNLIFDRYFREWVLVSFSGESLHFEPKIVSFRLLFKNFFCY